MAASVKSDFHTAAWDTSLSLTHRRAQEGRRLRTSSCPDACDRSRIGDPCPSYYRMRLRPLKHSQQHNLLLDLEQRGNELYYAAPEFHLRDELNETYLAGSVEPQIWFFAPSDIGRLPDDGEHYVVFARDKSDASVAPPFVSFRPGSRPRLHAVNRRYGIAARPPIVALWAA